MEAHKVFTTIAKAPEKVTFLDKISDTVQPAIHRIYRPGTGVSQWAENFLNGVWLGHPLHPVLTDRPIGFWTTAVTLDVLDNNNGSTTRLGQCADTAMAIGSAAAVVTAAAGLTDWQHLRAEPRRVGMLHAIFNTITLGLFTASLAARGSRNRRLGKRLSLLGALFMVFGAFYGGDLTYRLKVGVKHSENIKDDAGFTPVMEEADLPESRMIRVLINEQPVMLVRRENRVYAISERCSHMGGPLSEGKLLSDNSVVCPWHGSRFDLEDGKVIDGPSAYSQAGYEARIFNRRIEVRPKP
jgi:nitrite reductase/ring-hydroxylating ferredoxin subunit/uncharacterized membrane protein